MLSVEKDALKKIMRKFAFWNEWEVISTLEKLV